MKAIRGQNDVKKGLRQPYDCLVELQLALCLQQTARMGGGVGRKSYQLSNKPGRILCSFWRVEIRQDGHAPKLVVNGCAVRNVNQARGLDNEESGV